MKNNCKIKNFEIKIEISELNRFLERERERVSVEKTKERERVEKTKKVSYFLVLPLSYVFGILKGKRKIKPMD